MKKRNIQSVWAHQIYTKRGHPGVEVIVRTEGGQIGRAECTAGLSVGSHEVQFTYDGGTAFRGKGVQNACDKVNEIIAPKLIGLDASDQKLIDQTMLDIMPNAKVKLGGNGIAATSAAVMKAGAAALDIPLYQHIGGIGAAVLPVPGVNVVTGELRYGGDQSYRSGNTVYIGSQHGSGKPSYTVMAYDFDTYTDASHACWDFKEYFCEEMAKIYPGTPNIWGSFDVPAGVWKTDEELWELLVKCINRAGYEGKMGIQVDIATDIYYNKKDHKYYGLFDSTPRTKEELMDFYKYMVNTYPFVILEDPFNEDDFEAHAWAARELGIQIVGDDLFTTDPVRVMQGIKCGAANTVLLKVNQVGTITEAMEMVQMAYQHGYAVMPSEARGEGIDIADYSVGINAGTIRECSVTPPANRLLEIEHELGKRARFAGKAGIKGAKFSPKNTDAG